MLFLIDSNIAIASDPLSHRLEAGAESAMQFLRLAHTHHHDVRTHEGSRIDFARITRRRVQTVNRLQALLAELLPGQAKKDITPPQAKAMLASVRPRDIAGRTRRRIAAEELAELIAVEPRSRRPPPNLKRWSWPAARP